MQVEVNGNEAAAAAPEDAVTTPEGTVVNAALQYLRLYDVFCWRNNTGAFRDSRDHVVTFGYRGSSDILGVTKTGRLVACECKFGKGKLSESQAAFLEEVRRRGGIAIVVNEATYQEVIDTALRGEQ